MLSAKNIWGRRINFDSYRVIAEEDFLGEDRRTMIKAGDVLLTIVGTIGRAAVVPLETAPFTLQRSVAVLKPKTGFDPRYVAYAMESPDVRRFFEKNAKGTAQKGVYLKTLASLPLPIAPSAEQRSIADKLDRLLAAVDTCKARLDAIPTILKRFRQSVLAAATSGELTQEWRAAHGLQLGWQDVRLDEIADIQGGITKDSKKQLVTGREVPYLRVANVQRGYLDLSEIKTIRVPEEKLSSLMLRPGDVLFTEGGDIDKLGRGWIWEGQIAACTYQNHIFRARLFDGRNQPKYVSWWANHRGLNYFLGSGKQTTNLASINKSQLSALPISLPSPEEQAEIVVSVESLLSRADQLEARITTVRALVDGATQGLFAKAFRGELVPQDTSDESASRLLERIKDKTSRAAYSISGNARIRVRRPQAAITINRSRPNIRGQRHVLKRLAVSDNHLSAILAKTGSLSPEVLLRESQLEIDDFYDQLKDEENRGLLREIRSGVNKEISVLEAVL